MLRLRDDHGKLEYGVGAVLSLGCRPDKETGKLMVLRSIWPEPFMIDRRERFGTHGSQPATYERGLHRDNQVSPLLFETGTRGQASSLASG